MYEGARPAVCQATLKTAAGAVSGGSWRTGCCFQATAARVIVIFMSREVVTFDAARGKQKVLTVEGGEGGSYKRREEFSTHLPGPNCCDACRKEERAK